MQRKFGAIQYCTLYIHICYNKQSSYNIIGTIDNSMVQQCELQHKRVDLRFDLDFEGRIQEIKPHTYRDKIVYVSHLAYVISCKQAKQQ